MPPAEAAVVAVVCGAGVKLVAVVQSALVSRTVVAELICRTTVVAELVAEQRWLQSGLHYESCSLAK